MIFGAKCKSLKILVVVMGLIGTTFVADCQAERNPVSPVSIVKQSHFQAVVCDKTVAQLEAFKRDRIRSEKRWNMLKQFVGQQVAAVSDKFARSGLSDWWTQRVSPIEKPVAGQQTGKNSVAISPSTLMVKLAGNMSAVQWWKVSSQTTVLFDSIQGHVVHTSMKLRSDVQANFLQWAKTNSNHVSQKVNDFAASSLVQGLFVVDSEQMASKPKHIEDVNETTAGDPYWSYYLDCDFWGVEFNPANEE